MLGVLLQVFHSLVLWNTYMVRRLMSAGGILVLLGETVTTTNDRRLIWIRLLSLFPHSSDNVVVGVFTLTL